jgi:restriction system protein
VPSFAAVLAIVVGAVIFGWMRDNPGPAIAIVIMIGIGIAIFVAGVREHAKSAIAQAIAYRDGAMHRAKEIIDQHAKTLSIKYHQLVRVDEYGIYHTEKWVAHKDYFIDNVVFPNLRSLGYSDQAGNESARADISNAIEVRVVKANEENGSFSVSEVKNGNDFEVFCSKMLERYGWSVIQTPTGADQGLDLLAFNSQIRVAIQCKYYSQPVGNKAVQEIYAAKSFSQADFAVVVSNSSYTNSAKQLAQANGVLLMHHSELSQLEVKLGHHCARA